MAEKFHINSKGEPGRCHAQHGGCPFGSEEEHYATKGGASAAYERSMSGGALPTLTKAPTREQVEQVLESMARGEDTIPDGVEFVGVETKPEVASDPKPISRVEILQNAIQEELDWCDDAEEDAKKQIEGMIRYSGHIEANFGAGSGAHSFAEDAESRAYDSLKDIEQYRVSLLKDRERLNNPVFGNGVNSLRETLKEKKLKKELQDLRYASSDEGPSLRELEAEFARPRGWSESTVDYQKYLQEAGSEASDSNRELLLAKHARQNQIIAELDEIETKRKESELPEGAVRRNAEVDAKVHENVVLFGKDEESLKTYNSFGNRVRRLFSSKKDVLTDRARLDMLPAGRKLIDYDPSGKNPTVWTKIGEDQWVDGFGNITSDNKRKLPATIIK